MSSVPLPRKEGRRFNWRGRDKEEVMAFLRDVRDYPSLIIDVRGNGRGATSSWMNYLVSPLRQDEDPVTWTYYELVRESVQDNPAARVWLDSSGVPAEAPDFPYGEAPDGFDVFRVQQPVPVQVLSSEKLAELGLEEADWLQSMDPVGFAGRIYLLVDREVYSAAEALAAFAKATGWATIVGPGTGGSGIGGEPVHVSLPNSRLVVKSILTVGLNPDGTVNQFVGTTPDVIVDYTREDFLALLNGHWPECDTIL